MMEQTKVAPHREEAVVAVEKVNRLLPLFFFLLISTLAYAISYDAKVGLGVASSRISLAAAVTSQEPVEVVELPIHELASNIEVFVDGEPAEWEFYSRTLAVNYNQPSGTHTITATYDADIVTYTERGYLFSFIFKPGTPSQLKLTITLPLSATLSKSTLTTPAPQLSSDGEHILLVWEENLQTDETFSVVGMYHPASSNWWVLPVFVLGVIVIAGVLVIYNKKSDKKLLLVLSDDERMIYQKIRGTPGITQKEVEKFTGFSKAKLSKLIRNLESSNLLKKQPHMKTNKLWTK